MTDDRELAAGSRELLGTSSSPSDPLAGMPDVDWTRPNIARMYDYHLGGAANFAVDREAAERALRVAPTERDYCRANRAFLGRAVQHLVTEVGIDQFLDLGSGVPTVGNVHEIARRHDPAARVAYVDWEVIACHHARNLLGGDEGVAVIEADVARHEVVLDAAAQLLDFTRPVAVLAFGIFDLIPGREAGAELAARYRDACAAGSALAVSNNAQLTRSDREVADLLDLLSDTSTPELHMRDRDETAALLPGYRLLEPGVVPAGAWRPDQPITWEEVLRGNVYGAVGVLDGTTRT